MRAYVFVSACACMRVCIHAYIHVHASLTYVQNLMYGKRIMSNICNQHDMVLPFFLQFLSQGLSQRMEVSMTGDIDLSLVTEQGSYDLTAKGGSANIGGMYVGLCLIEFILHN